MIKKTLTIIMTVVLVTSLFAGLTFAQEQGEPTEDTDIDVTNQLEQADQRQEQLREQREAGELADSEFYNKMADVEETKEELNEIRNESTELSDEAQTLQTELENGEITQAEFDEEMEEITEERQELRDEINEVMNESEGDDESPEQEQDREHAEEREDIQNELNEIEQEINELRQERVELQHRLSELGGSEEDTQSTIPMGPHMGNDDTHIGPNPSDTARDNTPDQFPQAGEDAQGGFFEQMLRFMRGGNAQR